MSRTYISLRIQVSTRPPSSVYSPLQRAWSLSLQCIPDAFCWFPLCCVSPKAPSPLPAAQCLEGGAAHWKTGGPQGNDTGPQSTGGPRPDGGSWRPLHGNSLWALGSHEDGRGTPSYQHNSDLLLYRHTVGQQEGSEAPSAPPRGESCRSHASRSGTENWCMKRQDDEGKRQEEEEEEEKQRHQVHHQQSQTIDGQQPLPPHTSSADNQHTRQTVDGRCDKRQRKEQRQQRRQRQRCLKREKRRERRRERGELRLGRVLMMLEDQRRMAQQQRAEARQQQKAQSTLMQYWQPEPELGMDTDNCSDVTKDSSDTSLGNSF